MTVADSIAQTLSADMFKSLNVTYFPQLGFLMAVELRRSWEEMAEDEELGDLEFQVHPLLPFASTGEHRTNELLETSHTSSTLTRSRTLRAARYDFTSLRDPVRAQRPTS